MTKPTILVTGATGKTGAHVVEQLIKIGFPVRALVHRRDERSARLTSLGAHVVEGDFLDAESLRAPLAGVKRAYFCYPVMDRLLEGTTNFALVAKEVGLEAIVNMSQIIAREGHPSPLTRQHWLAERVLDWAGIGATHIRPTFFAENPLMFNAAGIAGEGKLYQPHGDGRHAAVTSEDIARVVVGVLTDPGPHIGKVYKVTGPEALSQKEMAATFSRILGRPVEYVDLPLERWQKAMADAGLPPFAIAHLSYVSEDHKNGAFDQVTDVVRKVGGLPPRTFEDFVRDNAEAFRA